MRDGVYRAIKLLLELDPTVPAEHRKRILDVCRKESGAKRRRLGNSKQAAAILGCHPKTFARYAVKYGFTVIHHSRRLVRYDLDEVENFANQGVQDTL